ncbi:hypothetical protein AGMMS4952_02560 [Spirochaetia bacterium]|nr:hypothetical protein AGMMS4952_02560 [Spirochaetia bacterium]
MTTTTPEYETELTFEKVWAMFQETDRQFKETDRKLEKLGEETEKVIQETRKETEKVMQETRKETEKVMQETQKIIGNLGNRLGDMAEYSLLPNLPEKFRQYNFTFGRINQNVKMKDKENGISAEIDAVLENGAQAMAVEVKVNLKTADIDDHILRMEKIRKYADLHGDKRQFYGAVAATVISEEVELYAIRHGFYVIKPSGEDVTIVPPVSREIFW